MKTLSYSPLKGEYYGEIVIDKIVRFSKSDDGEVTFIHLTNGEIIESDDKIVGLKSRLDDLD